MVVQDNTYNPPLAYPTQKYSNQEQPATHLHKKKYVKSFSYSTESDGKNSMPSTSEKISILYNTLISF